MDPGGDGMSSHGDSGVGGRCGDGAGWNVLAMTHLVYDFLHRAKGPDGAAQGDAHQDGLWAKAKGIVQHQYALTPLSWACSLSEHRIEGRAITPDDFAWLWRFPDVEHAPLSRLVGYGWFCGRRYDLNAATLDPRWESEGVIDIVCAQWGTEKALSRRAGGTQGGGPRILDGGTGSGCLLIELLLHYPSAWGVGVDISADALVMAGKNAHRHGLTERARWILGDCAEVLGGAKGDSDDGAHWRGQSDGGENIDGDGRFSEDRDPLGSDPFDIIVSNPPYVPMGYVAPKNVALWDPRAALYAGVDGLDCYRSWVGLMVMRLAPRGILVLEIGCDQGPAVQNVCQHAGLSQVHILPDHDGKDRYVWGRL